MKTSLTLYKINISIHIHLSLAVFYFQLLVIFIKRKEHRKEMEEKKENEMEEKKRKEKGYKRNIDIWSKITIISLMFKWHFQLSLIRMSIKKVASMNADWLRH